MSRSLRAAAFFSGLVLLFQAFTLPSPVRDSMTGTYVSGFSLEYPLTYILLAPFCTFADALTVLSLDQAFISVSSILIFLILLFGVRKGMVAIVLSVGFIAWGALAERPMARLVAQDSHTLLIDFHSHTQHSHDGRKSFTPDKNRAWHRNQGYGAGFITDHNRTEGAKEAKERSRQDWRRLGYSSLEGEEVSLEKTHLVVLGVHQTIDNQPYDSDPAKIPMFIQEMNKRGLIVIASLPEYWLYHWGEGLQRLIASGIDGFEIVNSAPKALNFPKAMKASILDLAKKENLIITGISDTHGYGSATAAWNSMKIPEWRSMDPDTLEKTVIAKLKSERFQANQVLERARFLPDVPAFEFLALFGVISYVFRGLSPLLALSWVAWIFLAALLYSRFRSLLFNGRKA